MVYCATFLLALCSIVYELLLGQTLSAFLGNTILRYSVTIGLYMCSMGFGALLLPATMRKNPLLSLLKVEFSLSLLGGCSVLFLLALHAIGVENVAFSIVAHCLIVLIGILTGFEIPLLMFLRNKTVSDSDAAVLGVDYLGAFAGTMLFAFLLYPFVGLVVTSCMLGSINALVGVSLFLQQDLLEPKESRAFFVLIIATAVIALVFMLAAGSATFLQELTQQLYLSDILLKI